eukprot:TRINITY_DN26842_c0_g1_i1.p1 TRINITY_DN26842_c0_g1~~TRINITY_DN26842_c0_g1_i1.p1  ORF type:complete len:389 (+),score=25.64 TRINITY_DN26842_c0_g1_i1:71-1237(+)
MKRKLSITLMIRMPCGTTHAVDATGDETMAGLYTLVSLSTGAEKGTFELRFEGEKLPEVVSMDVQGVGMCEGAEIDLLYKSPTNLHVSEMTDEKSLNRLAAALEEDSESVVTIDVAGIEGGLCLSGEPLPKTIKHIVIVSSRPETTHITSIDGPFLSPFSNLLTIDLQGLGTAVTEVGSTFLSCAESLQAIDLTPFCNVHTIGNSFLSDCGSLTAVDLTPLSRVTTIGFSFLRSCQQLQSVNLSELRCLTSIDDMFMAECASLPRVDVTGLTRLASVGQLFLGSCSSLREIDLSPLGALHEVGSHFVSYCPSLASVTFSSRTQLTSVGLPVPLCIAEIRGAAYDVPHRCSWGFSGPLFVPDRSGPRTADCRHHYRTLFPLRVCGPPHH